MARVAPGFKKVGSPIDIIGFNHTRKRSSQITRVEDDPTVAYRFHDYSTPMTRDAVTGDVEINFPNYFRDEKLETATEDDIALHCLKTLDLSFILMC